MVQEISTKVSDLPDRIYHIVPDAIFSLCTDELGQYDPRNLNDFGGNAPYIHTTPSIKIMEERLGYFSNLEPGEYLLLEIYSKQLGDMKLTYSKYGEVDYHHLWGALGTEMFSKFRIEKTQEARIKFV